MGQQDFIILLPPSEGKAPGGNERRLWSPDSGVFGSTLGSRRSEVCSQLHTLKGGDGRLLGVKGVHLERAQSVNRSIIGSPTLPAWRRYTGVVWDHLDLASLDAPDRVRLLKRILVPTGVAGLVRADDPLPDYRLKMGARLPRLGAMSTWWREAVTEALAKATRARTVIDLLPQEHRAAIDWTRLPTAVRIDLVAKNGGVVGGHNAKAAKGLLARHLLTSDDTDIRRMVATFKKADYSATMTEGNSRS